MDFLSRLFGPGALRGWSYATLAVQSLIIVTGTIVRLTGSGLGCPTWPKCTEDAYIPHGDLTVHAAIEFGNRLLTFLLIAVAVAMVATALRSRRAHPRGRTIQWLSIIIALGVPVQAVVGGITVLTELNPFLVAPHLLISVGLVALSTWLVHLATERRAQPVSRRTRWLVRGTWLALMLAIWLGTLVTGSGPHAGDAGAARTGFDIETVAKLHAGAVWVVVGLSVACIVVLRSRASVALLLALLAQGLIGYVQYFTGLPIVVVALHMVGIPVCTIAGTWLLCGSRDDAAGVKTGRVAERAPVAG